MRRKDLRSQTNEGLADLAQRAEQDHEVQMARADLYKIAKYAIKLHEMLKGISEQEGLMGWQQAKITKASDYLSSVFHNLDYKMKFEDQNTPEVTTESDYKANLSTKLKEKAESKAQQRAAGAALAAKRGEIPVSDLVGASKEMYDSMSEKDLEDFAGTKHSGLPNKKD